MNPRWIAYAAGVLSLAAAVLFVGLATGVLAPYLGVGYDADAEDADADGEYGHTKVAVYDAETGSELGAVEAAVADTFTKRYVGLSETDELPEDRGMLFVHDDVDERTYVMRNMSFGIDIVFVDAHGTITEIHEAPAPGPDEDGNDQKYSGEGRYVLEVNLGWTDERGVEVGDTVHFELS